MSENYTFTHLSGLTRIRLREKVKMELLELCD